MKRFTILTVLLVCISMMTVAQTAQTASSAFPKVLTQQKIDDFVKAYPALEKEIEKLDEWNNTETMLETPDLDNAMGFSIDKASLVKGLEALKASKAGKAFIAKFKLAPDFWDVLMTLSVGYAGVALDNEIINMNNQILKQNEGDPVAQSMVAAMQQVMSSILSSLKYSASVLKTSVHPDDLALIQKNYEALKVAFNDDVDEEDTILNFEEYTE